MFCVFHYYQGYVKNIFAWDLQITIHHNIFQQNYFVLQVAIQLLPECGSMVE